MQQIEILHKICERQKETGSKTYLLHLEKMLFFCMFECEQKKIPVEDLPFSFEEKFLECVQSLNDVGMNLYQSQNTTEGTNSILKAIDLIMFKTIQNFVTIEVLGKMKNPYALKSITYAAQIQEKLSNQNDPKEKLDLASTFINKGAIQSQMNKHDKALESLNKALECLRQIEIQDEDDKKSHDALKIVALYNLGAENEHLFHKDKANQYYKEGHKLAQEAGENIFVEKFKAALKTNQL